MEEESGVVQYAVDTLGADGHRYDIEVDASTGKIPRVDLEDDDD